jgi:hypothetical protein
MKNVIKNKTDLDLANEALTELKPNVTATDRKDVGFSERTVVVYLNGQGKDVRIAIELLKFFRERIEARRKIIANG